MQYIPVKTRVLTPPQDDLLAVLDESLSELKNGDVIVVSSKVVAISEGNCVLKSEIDKKTLVAKEAKLSISRPYWSSPLTINHHAFIGNAGIDESNGGGYYILLPQDPFLSAKNIYQYLKKRFNLNEVGVIVSDSHSAPFRRGSIGVAIGFWGFKPTLNYVGKSDLFGRKLKVSVANLADGIAAGANIVMGEADEGNPLVIARNINNLTFIDADCKSELFVAFKDDTFRVLYERFLT